MKAAGLLRTLRLLIPKNLQATRLLLQCKAAGG
jgi:hypothetical protein